MRRIFLDERREAEFREKGYLKIPFLNPAELEDCLNFFHETDPKVEANFYSSIDSRDKAYRQNVDRILREKFESKVRALFLDFVPIAFTFIVKRPGADTLIRMHVDDAHADPARFDSVNLWCPLVDTNAQNGMMEVVEGSHRLPYPQRGLGLPFPYSAYEHLFGPWLKKVPMKAGEALLYHDCLIHGSGPNLSNEIRPAMITGLIPAEARQEIFFRYPGLPENACERFEISGDFWFDFDKHKRPDALKSLGLEEYSPVAISEEEFREILEGEKQK